jgi:hypothetical protein
MASAFALQERSSPGTHRPANENVHRARRGSNFFGSIQELQTSLATSKITIEAALLAASRKTVGLTPALTRAVVMFFFVAAYTTSANLHCEW